MTELRPSSYQPPPIQAPTITLPRTDSPQPSEPNVPVSSLSVAVGVELIVFGLRHDTPSAAKDDLTTRLAPYSTDNRIPPITIRQADQRQALDYAYVSLAPPLVDPPRPDILQELKTFLAEQFAELDVQWRVNSKLDKTRQVFFYISEDTGLDVKKAKDGLDDIFKSKGYKVQNSYSSSNTKRVTYTFFSSTTLQLLASDPPVVQGHRLLPQRPRFIQPICGLEIAVPGCSEFQNVRSRLDHYLNTRYTDKYDGDVVVGSRMELDGDVYCAVLKNWQVVNDVLYNDEWQPFSGSSAPLAQLSPSCRPILLYVLNSFGIPSNITELINRVSGASSQENKELKAEVEQLREDLKVATRMYVKILESQQSLIEHVNERFQQVTQTITHAMLYATTHATYLAANTRLESLEGQRVSYLQHAAIATNEQQKLLFETHASMLDPRIESAKRQLEQAQQQMDTFAHSLASVLPGIPVPALSSPPSQPSLASSSHLPPASAPPSQSNTSDDAQLQQQLPPHSSPASIPPHLLRPDVDDDMHDADHGVNNTHNASDGGDDASMYADSDHDAPGPSPPASQPSQTNTRKRRRPDRPRNPQHQSQSQPQVPLCLPLSSMSLTSSFTVTAPVDDDVEFIYVDDSGRTEVSCMDSNTVVPVPVVNSVPMLLKMVAVTILVVCLSASVSALSPPLRTFALNANGLGDNSQLNLIQNSLHTLNPHLIVIGETKNSRPVASRLRLHQYSTYENPGVPTSSKKSSKWGVILAVRKDIHSDQVMVPAQLRGRVSAADLHIPDSNGTTIRHRVIGIYAPWDPGVDALRDFWSSLTELCNNSPAQSWSIYDDFNATLATCEHSSSQPHLPDARQAYSQFLLSTAGQDLWSDIPDRTVQTHYTYKGARGMSIIDRVAVSSSAIVDAKLQVLHNFFGSTDHCALLCNVFLRGSATLTSEYTDSVRLPARYRVPRRDQRFRFRIFTDNVSRAVSASPSLSRPITTDDDFEKIYSKFGRILHSSAAIAFEKPSQFFSSPSSKSISSPTIRSIQREYKRVNRLVSILKRAPSSLPTFALANLWAQQYLNAFDPSVLVSPTITLSFTFLSKFHEYLKRLRSSLSKLRYREVDAELRRRATAASSARINSVLLGGSAKRLFPSQFCGPPRVVCTSLPNEPEIFVSSPEEVKLAMVQYFQNLYARQPRPPHPKPWMQTPSILAIRQKTSADPFTWPKLMSLLDIRLILRKGNPKPAPGPDGIEKWWLKHLDDDSLSIFQHLVNYILHNSHAPSCTKPSTLSIFHKRGSRTLLRNCRGVTFSNYILNHIGAWENFHLVPYCAKHNIIPPTQIASQPGVQGRDLLSFLAHLQTWAVRNKQSLYVLQRDQQKGFDMLEPEGFYDALRAYGLPQSLIDLDISFQSNVPYSILSAYGLTDPFIVNGVTKQGGPLSPLKSCLMTSLGHYWLNDLLRDDPGALVISTANCRNHCFHTPIDDVTFPVHMVEAMDDSLLLATRLSTTRHACLAMERLQSCYGAKTCWPKSCMYFLNVIGPIPQTITMPTVSPENPFDECLVPLATVPVSSDCIHFLRTDVDRPKAQYFFLRDLIIDFQLPLLSKRLPLTAIRRILSQCLISKIRPRLSYQPISHADAVHLDVLIASKVHHYFGYPFHPSSTLLSLPVSHFGFDFPSIAELNLDSAVRGLLRDLNHHVPVFRQMARITLADWSCSLNRCLHPFVYDSLHRSFLPFTFSSHRKLPFAWVLAHDHLQKLDISLHSMDQSHVFLGDVSLQHCVNVLRHSRSFSSVHALPNFRQISELRNFNLDKLSDFSSWTSFPSPHLQLSLPSSRRFPSDFLFMTWYPLLLVLHNLSLLSLVHADASLIPPSPNVLQHRSITFAALHDSHSYVASVQTSRLFSNILHGELYALILATLLYKKHPTSPNLTLLSDHLNAVRFLSNALSHSPSATVWAALPASSLYRWLYSLLISLPNSPTISHVRAHTSQLDIPSQANALVDRHASLAQQLSTPPPYAPLPTFAMADYVLYHSSFGYIESGIPEVLKSLYRQVVVDPLSFSPAARMMRSLYDPHPPPSHPYLRASSAYSASIQLYLRSGQLPTRQITAPRLHEKSSLCRFGCCTVESPHHLFVQCTHFNRIRAHYTARALESLQTHAQSMGIPRHWHENLHRVANVLFYDHSLWPLSSSRYYFGLLPEIQPHIPLVPSWSTLARERFITRLSNSWHYLAIQLAARIWGYVQRLRAYEVSSSSPRSARVKCLRKSLPSHLHHLISTFSDTDPPALL
ncbi:hypothetical protein D9758_006983 [Tetrapyrgos nigripes]|uniref:Reverse transcriptase domain-containing protein n=1 Tax=Tetrapyrgos nigripes TaxID=182062 RepID=A0A8H5GT66_9AGAR|nr:hypothetical protein D9758_006983 [Tetrapyrgos nigripes]